MDIFIFTYETEPTHTNTHGSDATRAANGKDARMFFRRYHHYLMKAMTYAMQYPAST
jgi:hypothetical protein